VGCRRSGDFHPYAQGRGLILKRQLVRTALAAIDAIWSVLPNTRIVHTDPLIHVVSARGQVEHQAAAEALHQAQYEAWNMITGYCEPELGGHPKYLDIIGVNYYPHNQWPWDGQSRSPFGLHDPRYRPLHQLLYDIYERYKRPIFIAETSSLGQAEPQWLRYVADEVRTCISNGIPIEGICLYPIIDAIWGYGWLLFG